MNRLDEKFLQLKKEERPALITYICAGDPDLKTTFDLVLELEKRGADIIELGVPFSDPIADGPTIQRAAQRALAKGTSLSQIFDLVKTIRRQSQVPIVLMTYFNPVLQFGLEKTAKVAHEVGVDGFILPDVPVEAGMQISGLLKKNGIDLICLTTPVTDKERFSLINKSSSGFIYYVSVTGVTGARTKIADDVLEHARQLKKATTLPLAIGFGVSTPQQVKSLGSVFDGVIVGSAIVNVIEQNIGKKDLVEKVGSFVESLKGSSHGG